MRLIPFPNTPPKIKKTPNAAAAKTLRDNKRFAIFLISDITLNSPLLKRGVRPACAGRGDLFSHTPNSFSYSLTHSFVVTQLRPSLTALSFPCLARKLKYYCEYLEYFETSPIERRFFLSNPAVSDNWYFLFFLSGMGMGKLAL